jgi:hypothetical protein
MMGGVYIETLQVVTRLGARIAKEKKQQSQSAAADQAAAAASSNSM